VRLPIPSAAVVRAADLDPRVPGELHGDRANRDRETATAYGSKKLVVIVFVSV
jgi:hypothetical protein